ncbi:unnamed protein product [Symbiodinium microadriaticum]|nr:unnamed protein product [Symbiodinium microadriaticum]
MMLASLVFLTLFTGLEAEGLREAPGAGKNATSALNATAATHPQEGAAAKAAGQGMCTKADETLMTAFGSGFGQNSFPRILSDCGKKSFNIFTGFRNNDFLRCLVDNTQLARSCASCFSISAQYGASNCKWSCFWGSWCGKGCLNCVAVKNAEVQACAGSNIAIPSTSSC